MIIDDKSGINIRTWIQGSSSRTKSWSWIPLTCLGCSRRMTAASMFVAIVRFQVSLIWSTDHFTGLDSRCQRWFLPHRHTCPSYFDREGLFLLNSYRFSPSHQSLSSLFIFSSPSLVFYQPIPLAFRDYTSPQYRIEF